MRILLILLLLLLTILMTEAEQWSIVCAHNNFWTKWFWSIDIWHVGSISH